MTAGIDVELEKTRDTSPPAMWNFLTSPTHKPPGLSHGVSIEAGVTVITAF